MMLVNKRQALAYLLLLGTITIPSLIYVTLRSGSMATGLFVVFIAIFLTSCILTRLSRLSFPASATSLPLLIMAIFFLAHISYIGYLGNLSIKSVLSVALLLLMLVCAGLLSLRIARLQQYELISIVRSLGFIVLSFGVLSLFLPVSSLNYESYPKSIFPFAEPSHYAITTNGFLLALCFYVSPLTRLLVIFSIIVMSLLLPSTLLALFAMLIIFIHYMQSLRGYLFLLVTIISLLVVFSLIEVDLSYHIDRLTFHTSTTNLTTLVYLQGWEDAYRALDKTNWVGLGFQNMGDLEPGVFGERIYQIAGVLKNRDDGGFFAAKLIGEFGALGILLLFFFAHKASIAFRYLRGFLTCLRLDKRQAMSDYPSYLVLAHSIIFSFLIEVFARGYGYFSPGVFLTLVAIFLTARNGGTPLEDGYSKRLRSRSSMASNVP